MAARASRVYLRGSTASGWAARASRSDAVKAMLSAVPTLTLRMPAATASAITASATPDEPWSTSGTGTAAASRAISSRSSWAERSRMACELPTATARPSTPVAATKAAASSGSVRTPGACAPSLPPISPSSASTHTPASWARATTSRVAATLSA